MSAFVVNRNHIDALVAVAMYGPKDQGEVRPDRAWTTFRYFLEKPTHANYQEVSREVRRGDADAACELGQLLTDENVRSVSYRYQDNGSLPGTFDDRSGDPDWMAGYRVSAADLAMGVRMTVAETLCALDCYEYQSCEHPEWEGSAAQSVCAGLRKAVIRYVPGYDDAPWEWTKPLRPVVPA